MNTENNNTLLCTLNQIENVKRCLQCNKIPLIELIEKIMNFI